MSVRKLEELSSLERVENAYKLFKSRLKRGQNSFKTRLLNAFKTLFKHVQTAF